MPCVVTDACQNCRDCLPTCPVDCFYEDEARDRVYIDGGACIECLCCFLVCPHDAILPLAQLALADRDQAALNTAKARAPEAHRLKSRGLRRPTPLRVQGRHAADAHQGRTQGRPPPSWWGTSAPRPRRFDATLFSPKVKPEGEPEGA